MAHQGFTEYQNETVDRVLGHPLVQQFVEVFDAEVVEVLDLRKVEQGELLTIRRKQHAEDQPIAPGRPPGGERGKPDPKKPPLPDR